MNKIAAYNFNAPAMRAQEYENNMAYNNTVTYPQSYDSYDSFESYQEPVAEKKKSNLPTILLGAAAIAATIFAVIKSKAAKNAVETARKEVAEEVTNLKARVETYENETRREAIKRIRTRNKEMRANNGVKWYKPWTWFKGKNNADEAKKVADEAAEAASKAD